MADVSPTSIELAQVVGIAGSAFLSGGISFISYGVVPSLLLAPAPLLARQWRGMYLRGISVAPPFAVVSFAAYSYLAVKLYDAPLSVNHPKGELYALAALMTISVMPYTLLAMKNVNAKLMAKAKDMESLEVKEEVTEVGLPKGESAKDLVRWWGILNFGRGVLPLVGALLGAWASFA
ncbi:Protein of unknown function DUF1772 [Lasallia pustulata]|nr:Protein of unknown function DUF1772 [Lasallia pustulata]